MSDKGSLKGESGICLNCRKQFGKVRQHQKFCSAKCRWTYWIERHPSIRLSRQELKRLKKILTENLDQKVV
jgi:hypothetical protein